MIDLMPMLATVFVRISLLIVTDSIANTGGLSCFLPCQNLCYTVS